MHFLILLTLFYSVEPLVAFGAIIEVHLTTGGLPGDSGNLMTSDQWPSTAI